MNDKRIIIAVGAALAVLVAVILALVFSGGNNAAPSAPEPEAGDLTVDLTDVGPMEPTRELRCYVNGQFVGMATLAVCAQRNGLATDALDVGLDETGALVATPTASLAPPPALPPVELTAVDPTPMPVEPSQPSAGPAPQPASGSPCLRHSGYEWRTVSAGTSLNACVQQLYAGTCVRPGEALYGRWGDVTLRLVPRRVEQSNDNNRFRALYDQDRQCQFPGLN
ncbi:MAG: hypothetical protein V4707_11885 [Pseudomonadota bacterium]